MGALWHRCHLTAHRELNFLPRTMSDIEAKQRAADAALALLPEEGVIGLGSGSTATLFINGVGRLVSEGRNFAGVPTSLASRQQAEKLGIPLLSDSGPWKVDVCVDGADEVSSDLNLIKGGGGCHSREKIVNAASALNIIIVDASKLSEHIGDHWPVPVEVLSFGHKCTAEHLTQFGEVTLRQRDGTAWITDAGNYIYDVAVGSVSDPNTLDRTLKQVPGVVETGLFIERADIVLVAEPGGVRELRPLG